MNTQKLVATFVLALIGSMVGPQSSSFAAVFITSTNISVADTNSDGQDIIVSGCTLTVDGPHSFASLLLTNGATLTHTPAYAGEPDNQVNLTIAGNCVISANSTINAKAGGYANNAGPGAGSGNGYTASSGGGHGGDGGYGNDNHGGVGLLGGSGYDSITWPTQPGSGGANGGYNLFGGYGGGVIALNVAGTLQVDGLITARGNDQTGYSGNAGGGAGGSILLTAGNFSGGGSLSADGGNSGGAGAGGGGRIAIYSGTDNFSGTISAVGGYTPQWLYGSQFGGAGTIYRKTISAAHGDLIVDNGGKIASRTYLGETNLNDARLVINGATLVVDGTNTFANLLLTNAAVLMPTPAYSGETNHQINFTITGDCVITSNSTITAKALGYAPNSGPGAGYSNGFLASSGGGHGGDGGYSNDSHGGVGLLGGAGYDSITWPTQPGSGGANGGYGGGVIALKVTGNLQVDGLITASGNGQVGNSANTGGGAGGSIRLTAGNFSGGGSLTCDGGSSGAAGGGGGGRIAIYSGADNFAGTISAIGGYTTQWTFGGQIGGAGTVYRSTSRSMNSLTIDNASQSGALTRLTNGVPDFSGLVDLRVFNYAIVAADAPLHFFGLLMTNHARIIPPGVLVPVSITLSGNAQVDTNSTIDTGGCGWWNGGGDGPGGASYHGGGGGHGGAGGSGADGYGSSGVTNGDVTTFGSGGGDPTGGYPGHGGYGGGVINLQIAGNFYLEGALKASGQAGYQHGGGGAGGGIYLRAGSFFGHGSVSADGGTSPYGGGGGGGFLDVSINDSNWFAGVFTANGGPRGYPSAGDGESGQVVFQSSGVPTNYFLGWFPSGTLIHPVSSVTFALAGGPHFPAAGDFQLVTPAGVLPGNQLSLTSDGNFLTLNFPAQTEAGAYAVRLPANPRTPGTSNYLSAGFTIASLHISGTVTLTNGWPLQGIRVGGGTTLTNGYYSFLAEPGSSGSFAPVLSGIFTPALRSYANIVSDLTGQDFTVSGALNPTLASSLANSGATAHLEADAIAGLRYQLQRSTNLWDWQDYGDSTLSPTNWLHFDYALTNAPQQFFRLRVSPP